MSVSFNDYMPTIWNRLMSVIGNEYGVSGLMGNLYAESNCCPWACQPNRPYTICQIYISNVNNHIISRSDFINKGCSSTGSVANGAGGFGLAQWTTSDRKAGLYDLWENSTYTSTADINLQIDWLITELTNYGLITELQNCTSVREASDIILTKFEKPKDQSETVKQLRASYGLDIYTQYTGTTPSEPTTPIPPPDPIPSEPQQPIKYRTVHHMPIWMYPYLR